MTPRSSGSDAPVLDRKRRGASVADVADDFGRSAIHDPLADTSQPVVEPRRELERVSNWLADLDWPAVIWIGAIHLAALAAPFYFTWSGLAICLSLYWVTGGLGVCQEGDPHSPRDGGLWSHILWMFPGHAPGELEAHAKRWAPDLVKDKGVLFLHHTFLLWHFLIGGALLASGWLLYDRFTGISWLLWGLAMRMVIVFHVTWFVNSASHMWGYRNYETTDDSRNLWWVGLLAFGEGWHNNHHAYQRMAAHGHRWWEFDPTYWVIRGMEALGLVWDVVHTPNGVGRKPGRRAALNQG